MDLEEGLDGRRGIFLTSDGKSQLKADGWRVLCLVR